MVTSEYLCPYTNRQCEFAQAAGEYISEGVVGAFSRASRAVASYGKFANLYVKIDSETIDSICKLELQTAKIPADKALEIMFEAKNQTVRTILPAFLKCGEVETAVTTQCELDSDNNTKQEELVKGSLGLFCETLLIRIEQETDV